MSHTIQHRGTVERVIHNRVYVCVERQSACAGCHAKGLCGGGGAQRTIEVRTHYAEEYKVGDRVIVVLLKPTMGTASILWGYMLPLVILLATLGISKVAGAGDGPAAVITIAMVCVYYFALWLARHHFDKKIQFTIIKE